MKHITMTIASLPEGEITFLDRMEIAYTVTDGKAVFTTDEPVVIRWAEILNADIESV